MPCTQWLGVIGRIWLFRPNLSPLPRVVSPSPGIFLVVPYPCMGCSSYVASEGILVQCRHRNRTKYGWGQAMPAQRRESHRRHAAVRQRSRRRGVPMGYRMLPSVSSSAQPKSQQSLCQNSAGHEGAKPQMERATAQAPLRSWMDFVFPAWGVQRRSMSMSSRVDVECRKDNGFTHAR